MARLIDHRDADWLPVRAELTTGVTGRQLLNGPARIQLTRVAPDGSFQAHRDAYGHLFYVLSGSGVFSVAGCEYRLTAGMGLQIETGEVHGYHNHSSEELLLISVNITID